MATKVRTDNIITPVFRVSFPHIFTQQENDDGSKSWGITMIFDKDENLSELKKIVKQAIIQKYGAVDKTPPKFRLPFRPGTKEEFNLDDRPEYAGKIICTARATNQPPGIVDPTNKPIEEKNAHLFYPGCYARADINAYPYEKKGNVGIAFGLNNVMKVADGEPLINRRKATDAFAGYATQDPEDNSDLFDASDL